MLADLLGKTVCREACFKHACGILPAGTPPHAACATMTKTLGPGRIVIPTLSRQPDQPAFPGPKPLRAGMTGIAREGRRESVHGPPQWPRHVQSAGEGARDPQQSADRTTGFSVVLARSHVQRGAGGVSVITYNRIHSWYT